MIRKKDEAKLDASIANAEASLVSSLATGVLKDRAAVRAAITQPWSNGQVEAQITKPRGVQLDQHLSRLSATANHQFVAARSCSIYGKSSRLWHQHALGQSALYFY
jgi:hypothetical protein